MKGFTRSGIGVFKKKTVKVIYPGNLISGSNVFIIDFNDYMVMRALLRGIKTDDKILQELWEIVENNDLQIPLYEVIRKNGFDIYFKDDGLVVVKNSIEKLIL